MTFLFYLSHNLDLLWQRIPWRGQQSISREMFSILERILFLMIILWIKIEAISWGFKSLRKGRHMSAERNIKLGTIGLCTLQPSSCFSAFISDISTNFS